MVTRDLSVMTLIQEQKQIDIERGTLQPLDAEGQKLAEGKRFTFDIVDTPADPLR